MATQTLFCNIPWIGMHLYWDGSFGACCAERNRPYEESEWQQYNIKNMTVMEWFNAAPMQKIRSDIVGYDKLTACSSCYKDEQQGHESKRIKENFKTVIFTKQAFDKSFKQSAWYDRFNKPIVTQPPIDWHIDFGNECNLACKMCRPQSSSLIESKYKVWGIEHEHRKNWTTDESSWNNFIKSIDQTKINRLHFIGGEPLLSKRFVQLVDHLLATNRTEISLSFTTNGTLYNQDLIDKLKKFRSVDVEVSIEAFNAQQNYIRQGQGDKCLPVVTETLNMILRQRTESFSLVLRSVPQLLNVSSYHTYIKWAWDNNVSIQSNLLQQPYYLKITVLPYELRQTLIHNFQQVKEEIENTKTTDFATMAVGRDVSRLDLQLINECNTIINILKEPEPANVKELQTQLAEWLMRWDKEYKLNAYDVYPEFKEFLNEIQYRV